MSINLIIGTGKRARETIIPALEILDDEIFLYSRNLNSKNPLLTKNYIKQLTIIDSNLKKFDRIFIAIPQHEIYSYIFKLSKFDLKKVELFIDTPIIGQISNLRIKKFIKFFKKVYVTEDWISKPFFRISNELIKNNNLGNIKKIKFINSGFSYHALAGARSILKNKIVLFAKKTNLKNDNIIYKFYFKNSKIDLVYPVDYDKGKTIIYCENGIISDSFIDKPNSYFISRKINNNRIVGYMVNGNPINFTNSKVEKKILLKIFLIKLENHTLENQEKIISLVLKLLHMDNQFYGFFEGAYDSFLFPMIGRFKYYFDFSFSGRSVIFNLFNLIFK